MGLEKASITNSDQLIETYQMGDSKRRKSKDPNYGMPKPPGSHLKDTDIIDILNLLEEQKGILLIPENSLETSFKVENSQVAEDESLKFVEVALEIARQDKMISLAIRHWLDDSPGFMRLGENTSPQRRKEDILIFNWFSVEELNRINSFAGVAFFISDLIKRSIPGHSYPCIFQSVPVIDATTNKSTLYSIIFMCSKDKPVSSEYSVNVHSKTFA
jgi:hypothetical protein